MEPFQDRSSGSDVRTPSDVPEGGKLRRIVGHTQGLVEDLREWIDLRLDLAILELEERVDDLRNELALGITLAFFGFFAALFVLTTVALGLGWVLGHPFWGFLIVSGLLVLIFAVLSQTRPGLMPPSNLFDEIRGEKMDTTSEDRPVREADTDGAEQDRVDSS